ncbi:SOS response-associated peptidase [Flavobacterium sp. PLA-1-15]|uniref:SOS response-associated peptidase n=1 Tax=Flavobacterium sp. PLA-1-15 TaxID=3380533 RepID=UPI003B77FE24
MCYHFQQHKNSKQVQLRFNATLEDLDDFLPESYNGFAHPLTPIIMNDNLGLIKKAEWGLLPSFVKDVNSFRNKTNLLNAKIETVEKLPSFRNYVDNRCLVIASSFYEWKWNDAKGKLKIKHQISATGDELFAMAGLYAEFEDKVTYTILTTEANELMATIHNSKKRMPVILQKEEEELWLKGEPFEIYHNRKGIELLAKPLDDLPLQLF